LEPAELFGLNVVYAADEIIGIRLWIFGRRQFVYGDVHIVQGGMNGAGASRVE
jgi:hypothetical protein